MIEAVLVLLLSSVIMVFSLVALELSMHRQRRRLRLLEVQVAEAARIDRADRHIEGIQRLSRGAVSVTSSVVRSVKNGLAQWSGTRQRARLSSAQPREIPASSQPFVSPTAPPQDLAKEVSASNKLNDALPVSEPGKEADK